VRSPFVEKNKHLEALAFHVVSSSRRSATRFSAAPRGDGFWWDRIEWIANRIVTRSKETTMNRTQNRKLGSKAGAALLYFIAFLSSLSAYALTPIVPFTPIPNYSGVNASQLLTADINNHLQSLANGSGGGHISVLDYGATGNGVTLDDQAIQADIDSTANNGNRGTNAVYLPATPGGNNAYLLGRPIYLHNAGANMYGDGISATLLETNYFGPSIIAENNRLPLVKSLLTGPGNALNLGGTGGFLELSMLLRGRLAGHSQFSIEFELGVPPSPSNSMILASEYDYPYQRYKRFGSTSTGAFNISYQSNNPHLNAQMTLSTSGLVSVNSANNSLRVGSHALGIYYDGAHVWTCADGTASTPVAATGTWVQSPWESVTLPDMNGTVGQIDWPDGGGSGSNDSFSGMIDNIRFSNVARATAGSCPSVPTQKYTFDSNTDLLLEFLGCSDGSQYCVENTTGQYALFAQAQSVDGQAVWFPILGNSAESGSNHLDLHDMEICAAISGTFDCQGMYVAGAAWSRFERLRSFSSDNGFNFFSQDFLGSFVDLEEIDAANGFEWGLASNNPHTWNLRGEQSLVCFNFPGTQTGIDSHGDHCLAGGALAFAILIHGATGTFHDFFVDQEAADGNWLANAYVWGLGPNLGGLTFIGGNLDTYGGAPFIVHEGSQYGSVVLDGTLLNNFAENAAASSVFLFYTPGGGVNADPLDPDQLRAVTIADNVVRPGTVALSNEAGDPHVETIGGAEGSHQRIAELKAAPSAAVGAGYCTVFVVPGTRRGTCKAQLMCGTSTKPFTLADKVGAGC
jgi:hypothetical protein